MAEDALPKDERRQTMKRIIAILLALIMIFAFAACKGKDDKNDTTAESSQDANADVQDTQTGDAESNAAESNADDSTAVAPPATTPTFLISTLRIRCMMLRLFSLPGCRSSNGLISSGCTSTVAVFFKYFFIKPLLKNSLPVLYHKLRFFQARSNETERSMCIMERLNF